MVPVRLAFYLLRILSMLLRFGSLVGGLLFLALIAGLVIFAAVQS